MSNPCPACQGARTSGQYLCRTCWFRLTAEARRQLNHTGPGAVRRAQSLFDQIRAGIRLPDIHIE